MEKLANGIAENNYVVSVANLGGIVAFLLLLIVFAKWAYRFGKTAYHQNVRIAIYRSRRRSYGRARRAARDLHTFISMIVVNGIMLLLAVMASITGLVGYATRFTLPSNERFSAQLGVSQSWDVVVTTMMLYAPIVLLLFLAFRLLRLALNTERIRRKLRVKLSRKSAEQAAALLLQ